MPPQKRTQSKVTEPDAPAPAPTSTPTPPTPESEPAPAPAPTSVPDWDKQTHAPRDREPTDLTDGQDPGSAREQSAEVHPSGNLDVVASRAQLKPGDGPTVVVDGGQVSIRNYEPVSGADGANSQTELDNQ